MGTRLGRRSCNYEVSYKREQFLQTKLISLASFILSPMHLQWYQAVQASQDTQSCAEEFEHFFNVHGVSEKSVSVYKIIKKILTRYYMFCITIIICYKVIR